MKNQWMSLVWGLVCSCVIGLSAIAEDFVSTGTTWWVSTTGSDETGDGLEANPYATVNKAVQQMNKEDIVKIGPGVYTLTEVIKTDDAKITSDSSRAHLTIQGADPANRPVINGNGTLRGMELHGRGMLFKDLVISNCLVEASDSGAAMKLDCSGWNNANEMWDLGYKFENCDFIACTNTCTTTETTPGALYIRKGIFSNCLFKDNYGGYSSGAVYSHCKGSGPTSQFFYGCRFVGNSALRYGGAVKAEAGDHSHFFYDCHFVSNVLRTTSAEEAHGGAIYGNASVVSNCLFRGNYSPCGGAGIFLRGAVSDVTITDSVFEGNRLGSNKGNYHGGAALATWSPAIVSNNVFVSNSIDASNEFGYGGAVYFRNAPNGDATIVFSDNVLSNNTSRKGGAVYLDAQNNTSVVFERNTFVSNHVSGASAVGGAVYMGLRASSGAFTLRKNLVVGNTAIGEGSSNYGQGGGFYLNFDKSAQWTVNVLDNVYSNNYAKECGGGVRISTDCSSTLLIDRNRFEGNSVYDSGAGCYAEGVEGFSLNIRNSLFACNSVSNAVGGGLYFRNKNSTDGTTMAEARCDNCTFAKNEANKESKGKGGAAFIGRYATLSVTNCLFSANSASVTGTADIYANTGASGVLAQGNSRTVDYQRFTDPDNGDYTLKPGSGGPNKGIRLDWMTEDSTDLTGETLRILGPAPDLGCYEASFVPGLTVIFR